LNFRAAEETVGRMITQLEHSPTDTTQLLQRLCQPANESKKGAKPNALNSLTDHASNFRQPHQYSFKAKIRPAQVIHSAKTLRTCKVSTLKLRAQKTEELTKTLQVQNQTASQVIRQMVY